MRLHVGGKYTSVRRGGMYAEGGYVCGGVRASQVHVSLPIVLTTSDQYTYKNKPKNMCCSKVGIGCLAIGGLVAPAVPFIIG